MSTLLELIGGLVRMTLAIALSSVLITIIPLLQRTLIDHQVRRESSIDERQVTAELVRIQKEEPKRRQVERVRTVGSTSGKASAAGSGGIGSMSFNFVPDLGVEGEGPGLSVTRGEFAPVIFEQGQTDEDMTPIYRPMPQFPAAATKLGIEGDAEVVFIVNIRGKVEAINIVKIPHPSFDPEIRKTLASWRFKPAKNQGIPVNVRVRQNIKFTLEDE